MMKRALLTGIAALLLATGACAKNPADMADAECQIMVGDHMVKLWVDNTSDPDALLIIHENGETERFGPGSGFSPNMLLLYSMVHNHQCRALK
jgi:hypothetical protein